MWYFNLLPDWFYHLIPLAGVACIFASMFLKVIPFVSTYYQPMRIIGVTVLLIGVFFEGALHNNAQWVARVKEMEAKVAEAQVKSQKQNTRIVEKVVTRTKIVREKGQMIIKYIDKDLKKYDNQCNVPNEFVTIHNQAAEQPK